MYINYNNTLDERNKKLCTWYFIVRITALICFYSANIFGQVDMFIGGNNRPVANAGKNIKAISKGSIFLDGSRSYVGDGSKIKYQWIFAPGLAQKIDNDLSSEISVKTYGSKYLKSVETHKQVLELRISDNPLGTKLEVVLSVKDRIGFEDTDTLIVEYFDPSIKSIVNSDSLQSGNKDLEPEKIKIGLLPDSTTESGILVQGLFGNNISSNDAHIINSIIKDQIRKVGFNYQIYLNKDFDQVSNKENHTIKCKTNDCVSRNAKLLNAGYAITWEFANSIDMFSLRIFNTESHDNFIDEVLIPKPYIKMNESGVYGLERDLRAGTSDIMSANNFKDNISIVNRLIMKNDKWISYGKYPIILGITYLLFDNIFSREDEDPALDIPPGFPHD